MAYKIAEGAIPEPRDGQADNTVSFVGRNGFAVAAALRAVCSLRSRSSTRANREHRHRRWGETTPAILLLRPTLSSRASQENR